MEFDEDRSVSDSPSGSSSDDESPISFQHSRRSFPQVSVPEDDVAAAQATPSFPKVALPATAGYSKMALKYMQKHSATGRVGKNETGISIPLEAMKRKEGAGLGAVPEASSLPSNRAFEAETNRRRKELEEKQQKEIRLLAEEQSLQRIWRRRGFPISSTTTTKPTPPQFNFDTALAHWIDLEGKYQREIQVAQTLAKQKQEEMLDQEQNRNRLQVRIAELESVLPLLRKLVVFDQQALVQFSHVDKSVIRDYELQAVPSMVLSSFVEKYFEETPETCLEMALLLRELFPHQKHYLFANVNLPRLLLEKAVSMTADQLHAHYLPWIQHFPQLFTHEESMPWDLIFSSLAPIPFSHAEITQLSRWISLLGKKQIQDQIQRRLGDALFRTFDLSLFRKYLDAELITLEDFSLLCQGTLNREVRSGGHFLLLCETKQGKTAARLYQAWKEQVPLEALEDTCTQGRLRFAFDFALEGLRMAISDKYSPDVSMRNALEPQAHSFSEAKHLESWRTFQAKSVASSSDQTFGNLRNTVESMAMSMNREFHALGNQRVKGKQVYVFGNAWCYFDYGVVVGTRAGTSDWKPMTIETLVNL